MKTILMSAAALAALSFAGAAYAVDVSAVAGARANVQVEAPTVTPPPALPPTAEPSTAPPSANAAGRAAAAASTATEDTQAGVAAEGDADEQPDAQITAETGADLSVEMPRTNIAEWLNRRELARLNATPAQVVTPQ